MFLDFNFYKNDFFSVHVLTGSLHLWVYPEGVLDNIYIIDLTESLLEDRSPSLPGVKLVYVSIHPSDFLSIIYY